MDPFRRFRKSSALLALALAAAATASADQDRPPANSDQGEEPRRKRANPFEEIDVPTWVGREP